MHEEEDPKRIRTKYLSRSTEFGTLDHAHAGDFHQESQVKEVPKFC